VDAPPASDLAAAVDGALLPDLPLARDAIVGCTTNADCLGSEYCHLDSGCLVTGAKMGTCKARPLNCPEYYSPTCGCDGKTYGNPCDAHGAGTNVAYAGTCQSCDDIDTAYQAAVTKAKKCCAMCNTIQCTLKVKTEIACPCTTYVEQSNQAAVQEMSQLEAKWIAAGCVASGCPPMPCPQVGGASCGFGATEVCIDNP